MATVTIEEVQQDELAMSVARALASANIAAESRGVHPGQSLVTVFEESSPAGRGWRIHYGPRDYVHRRGGDLTVVVSDAGDVREVLRGQ